MNSLKQPLHILHLEENAEDAERIRRILAEAGIACDITRVATRRAFEAALRQGGFELILTDHTLAAFDGRSALDLVKERSTEAEENKAREAAEEAMEETVSRYRALYDRALHCVYVHDFDGNFVDANEAALNLLGYTRNEVLSLNIASLVDKGQLSMAFKTINEIRQRGSQKFPRQFKLRKKNGEEVWLETDACLIYRNDKPYAIQGIALDITDRIRLERELRKLSLIDSLTGLYNRRGFFTHAEHQMKLAGRTQNRLTLVFADVDDLKSINDTRGHGEGDKVLVETATFLKTVFRESDIIARVGGDEFVVLALENSGTDAASGLVRWSAELEAFNASRNSVAPLSISIGAVCYRPDKPCSIDELLAQADRLMYEQKGDKRRCLVENGGGV